MPFEPGQTGNPGGRPKGDKKFREAINLAVKRVVDDKTALARIAESLVNKAIEGDVAAIREVGDRLDGKVAQTIAGDQDNPLLQVLRWATPQESIPDPSKKSLSLIAPEPSGKISTIPQNDTE